MNCPICEKETPVVCACGFCPNCIKQYGHDKCSELARENLAKRRIFKEIKEVKK
ncbi:MAG: hypothetical protein NT076_03775 [Candidatus Pacearchaeota archaeon]|nr:hypothetical protein [Candidatus Pacearchaeota archaeon]